MLNNMSANQRLILAVVLSFVFFVAYTAIFPPEQPDAEANATAKTQSAAVQTSASTTSSLPDARLDHTIAVDEQLPSSTSSNLVRIEAKEFSMTIDTLGRIASKVLKAEKYNNNDNIHSEMVAQVGTKPLHIRFADADMNKESLTTPYTTNVREAKIDDGGSVVITMQQKLSNQTVVKKMTIYADGHYDVNIVLSNDTRYFVYLGQHVSREGQMMMAVHGAMVYHADGLTEVVEDDDAEGRKTFSDVHLTSSFDQYFASIFYGLNPNVTVTVDSDREANPTVYIDGSKNFTFNGYIGPKDYKVLKSIDPVLVNAIEYGWFTFVSAPLFSVLLWLHGIFGNWGWAIIALTLLIRMILFPLTYKGMLSMQKMKDVAPKIKEIQAKHKGDPQRMNAAVMETYKKEGANPLGGCLPLVLQIPIFFAIYRVLLNAVELQGAEWILWVNDLSRMDPYYILPVLMGATMFYQQHITPNNFTDPMQEKIFKYLPVIFTFFFITFPSGLVLYWFVNNIFSITQQFIVNKQFAAMKAMKQVRGES
ncbi:MAG: membrane protein insertase YidC [Helicobacteraceae bacterium]|nr:membrane protein insertase YidC [Helicobacteraceae bacterium]